MAILILVPSPLTAQAEPCAGATVLEASASISREALCSLVSEAAAARTDGLYVSRNGTTLLEWRREGAPERIQVMSVTKSVASLAVGRMLLDGELATLDTPVSDFLPEWRQGRKAEITVRHLLTHTSGLQDVRSAGVEIEPAPDAVQLAIAAELETDPGTAFKYNNKAVNLLARIVEVATGRRLDEYLKETVFLDIGLADFEWVSDAAGNPYVMAGLTIRARDLGRVGEVMLNEGRWHGMRVIDPTFAREALRSQHELFPRHGLLWWRLVDDVSGEAVGAYGDGWLGQSIVVLPRAGLVAVRLIDRASWRTDDDSFSGFRDRIVQLAGRR